VYFTILKADKSIVNAYFAVLFEFNDRNTVLAFTVKSLAVAFDRLMSSQVDYNRRAKCAGSFSVDNREILHFIHNGVIDKGIELYLGFERGLAAYIELEPCGRLVSDYRGAAYGLLWLAQASLKKTERGLIKLHFHRSDDNNYLAVFVGECLYRSVSVDVGNEYRITYLQRTGKLVVVIYRLFVCYLIFESVELGVCAKLCFKGLFTRIFVIEFLGKRA